MLMLWNFRKPLKPIEHPKQSTLLPLLARLNHRRMNEVLDRVLYHVDQLPEHGLLLVDLQKTERDPYLINYDLQKGL